VTDIMRVKRSLSGIDAAITVAPEAAFRNFQP
jgi:hypothetical protein